VSSDLLEVMRTTFAAREFDDAPVGDDALRRILDDARFAPSGGNRQGWRVIVVREPTTKRALAELAIPTMQRYVAQTAAGESPWNTIVPTQLTPEQIAAAPVPERLLGALANAPVLLVVCLDLALTAAFDSQLARVGVIGGASVYPFVWNLLLAANAEGLGGTLTTFCTGAEPAVQRLLGIPERFAVAAVVPLGRPRKSLTQLKRRPVEAFATRERFDGAPLAASFAPEVASALANDRVVDITTRGRTSGAPRRTEIWFWRAAGRLYLTSAPGRVPHWYRNLLAEPRFTLHLKESHSANLAAFARAVQGEAERLRLLERILAQIDGNAPDAWFPSVPAAGRPARRAMLAGIAADRAGQLPRWLAASPLVEIRL
jgi:deazaflavin-dependent oxidoreductase (nitroreductase family)